MKGSILYSSTIIFVGKDQGELGTNLPRGTEVA